MAKQLLGYYSSYMEMVDWFENVLFLKMSRTDYRSVNWKGQDLDTRHKYELIQFELGPKEFYYANII